MAGHLDQHDRDDDVGIRNRSRPSGEDNIRKWRSITRLTAAAETMSDEPRAVYTVMMLGGSNMETQVAN